MCLFMGEKKKLDSFIVPSEKRFVHESSLKAELGHRPYTALNDIYVKLLNLKHLSTQLKEPS